MIELVLWYLGIGLATLVLAAYIVVPVEGSKRSWTWLAIVLAVLFWPFVLILMATFGLEE